MVSKNNQWQHLQVSAQRVPHYGLRKLSVGVASVLLSTTLYMGVSAHADTVTTPSEASTPAATALTGSNTPSGETTSETKVSSAGTVSGNPVSQVPTGQVTPENPVAGASTDNATGNAQPANKVAASTNNVATNTQPATNQPVNTSGTTTATKMVDTANKTTLNATFTWSIHYTDETGKKLLPDSVIAHDYTRTDTGDQMGNWSYVPDSVKVTGTPNNGQQINNPTIKFDQSINGGPLFDGATWQAVAAAVDGYTPNYGSVGITDELPKNPESLHATSMVDSGTTHEFTFVYTKQPTKVTINYVDDEQGEKVVGTGTVSGKSGTEVTITPQLPKGYMLTPNKDVPSTYTVTDAANQVVTIYVQKQFVDLSATDPQAKQTRTITLHYVYGAGDKQGQPAFDDAVLDIYYHRTATLDRTTNQTTYGDWLWDQSQGDTSTPGYHVVSGKWTNLPQTWATVQADVPSIKGYYADLGQNDPTNTNHVPANTWVFPTYNNSTGTGVSEEGKGATAYLGGYGYEVGPTHTIKYMPNKTTVTVNYVDDDNNGVNVGHQSWNGTTGQHIDLTLTLPDNYVLTPGWVNPKSYDFDGTNSSWYTVHVKHKTQDVTDQQPKDQVTKVTRLTRNHLYGDGPHKGERFAEPDIFDLAWKRTATKDLVTDKVTFGDWQVNWDDSKSVQGRLTARPSLLGVDGDLYSGKNGYSYKGDNSHSEFVRADGSVKVNVWNKYGWRGTEMESYPVLNYYYGPGQVKIPIVYVDVDTGQEMASKTGDDALTGDDFRDGNTVTIDQNKLTSLPTTLIGCQLLPGQTLPTSYKIDTFAGVKGIKVQVAKDRSVNVTFVDDNDGGSVVGTPTTITGYTGGDPVALKLTVPDKYELADGQQLPTTYTFTKGSGDLTIHLKHQVVQREATIDVQLALITSVHINDDNDDIDVVPQTKWTPQLDDELKNDDDLMDVSNKITSLSSVEAGTLTGHVNYDLVNEKVVSLGDDWTTLNLGGQTCQMPDGTDVVNGVVPDYNNRKSELFKESYLEHFRNADPDYVNRPWHGYLSVNASNNNSLFDGIRQIGLQTGLVGDEPNALVKATGDRAATGVEMGDKVIDLSLLKDGADLRASNFSEQNGQPRAKVFLPAVGVYIPYVAKTATRTINVTTPDGKTTAFKQTATLAKQVDFTHDAHPAWTIGEWANYEVPTISGYTPSQSKVAKETVTGATEDQTVNITYTANPQTSTVVYQTENGTPVHTTTVNGKTGQTVKVPNEVPVGWHVVNGTVPSEITFGPDGAAKTIVTIDHSHVTVTPDAPKTTGDKLPDNPNKAYPAGIGETDLNKTVTRTIKVTTPDGQTKTVEQTVKLTRTADVDEVTGEVKYSDWTTGNWSAYTAPSVLGYTASQSNVVQQAVTSDTKDQTINITYTANEHQISIEYVDNATGKILKTDHVSGKTGQTVPITPHVPDGWELVSGQSVPNEVTLGADGAPATVIKVQSQERSVTVKFVDDQFDERQVGQATITGRDGETVDLRLTVPDKYQLADGQQLPITYTFTKGSGDLMIHLVHQVVQREATVDVQLELTTIVHSGVENDYDGDFSFVVAQNQWTQLDDEIKDSRNSNSDKVFSSVNLGTLTGHVNYDLVDNNVVSLSDDWTSLNLDGHTYQLPDGTDVVNGVLISSLWGKSFKEELLKYHPDTDPDYVNRAWHGYLSVNATNEIDPSDFTGNDLQVGLVGNEPNALAKAIGDQAATAVKTANKMIGSNWLKDNFNTLNFSKFSEQNGQLQAEAFLPVVGVYIPYVEKTATRMIKVTTPDGKTTAVKQTATLAKQVDFGKDAHPDWTKGEWASYDVPTIPGYTASQSSVAKETVMGTTKDQIVNITYTANPQTTHVNYVDVQGNLVHTTTVNGQTSQTVDVPSEVPTGWKLVDGQTVPATITFGPDGHADTSVKIEHQHVTVTPDKPQTDGTKLPDNLEKSFHGVEASDLNKTVTRTIKVTTPDGQTKTVAQTVKLTRTADVDEVTGEVTYGDWTTGEWAAYDVPSVSGYTPSQATVAKESVTATSKDTAVEISYLPTQHQISVEYVDDDDHGKVVKTDQMPGKTDQTITVTPSAPTSYDLVDSNNRIYNVTSADGQIVQIHVKHHQVTTSESKTVTRTINVHTPHDGTKVVKQIAKLTRDVTTDQVTGEKTYGDWSATEWDRYAIPAVAGYVPSIEQVAQQVVNGTTADQTIDVTYSSGEHTTHINYVDKDGNIVHTTTIKGQTDGTSQVPNETPAGWTVVGEPVPSELAFGPDGHVDVIVTIGHKHVTVTPDQPKTSTDKLPDNPAKTYPNGVGHDDLNKTITRMIKVTMPDGQTKTVAQTVKLTRTADVDEVTGKVAYGEWTTGELPSYEVPAVPGYTASQNEVPVVKVTDATKDQMVTVTYTANDQTTHVNYIDGNGEIVHTTTVTGKTGQTVKVPNEVPTGWTITDGRVPNEIIFGPDGHNNVTVTIDHQHVTVTPDKPQTDGTKLPDNPSQTFHGVAETDLNKTITRTIIFNVPGQGPRTITQTAKLTRTATVDEVTGAVTYGDWTTAQWPAVTVPVVDGYTTSQTQIPAVTVGPATDNQTVTIDYQAVEVPTTPTTTPAARPMAASHTSGAKSMATSAIHTKVALPTVAATPVASAAKASQLPQTGTDKVVSTIMTSLGLLMGALSAFVLGRKRKGKGYKA